MKNGEGRMKKLLTAESMTKLRKTKNKKDKNILCASPYVFLRVLCGFSPASAVNCLCGE